MTSKNATAATPMDPELRERLLRAARGEHQSSAGVAIGIRYRTPVGTVRPAPTPASATDRIRHSVLAGPAVLADIADAPRPGPSRHPRSQTPTEDRRPAGAVSPPGPAFAAAARACPRPRRPRTIDASTASGRQAQLLHSYRAHACTECGGRYRDADPDHQCGPLIAVLVTVTRGDSAGDSPTGLLGSYPAYTCETCGDRRDHLVPEHPCGPMIPVTVTISLTPGLDADRRRLPEDAGEPARSDR